MISKSDLGAYLSSGPRRLPKLFQDYADQMNKGELDGKALMALPPHGYADRLKGIVSAFVIAVLCRRRFLLQWAPEPSLRSVFEPHLIQWHEPGRAIPKHIVRWFSRDVPNLSAHMHAGKFAEWVETEIFKGENEVGLVCNQHLLDQLLVDPDVCGALEATDDQELFRIVFETLFKLDKTSSVLAKSAELQAKIAGRSCIGVHIRVGANDLWNDPHWEDQKSIFRYETKLKAIVGELNLQGAAVYLSTDSRATKDLVAKGQLLKGFDVIQQDVQPLHISLVRLSAEAAVDALADTVTDHLLLSTCDVIIRGQGGFATTASFLGPRRLYTA